MPQKQYWSSWYTLPAPYNSGHANNQPKGPVLGTNMTQCEWDKQRELLRKAEEGGKVNELLTIQREEMEISHD